MIGVIAGISVDLALAIRSNNVSDITFASTPCEDQNPIQAQSM